MLLFTGRRKEQVIVVRLFLLLVFLTKHSKLAAWLTSFYYEIVQLK